MNEVIDVKGKSQSRTLIPGGSGNADTEFITQLLA